MRPRPMIVWALLAASAVGCVTPTALPANSETESTPTEAAKSSPTKPATSQTLTVVKWAIDALPGSAEPFALELFYDGLATAFRIIGPDGGLVVSVPAAVPTALGPDTCLNRVRAGGLHNAAWIAIESALERSFEEKASSYVVIASLANGDTIPLSLQDSGCRNGVTALAKQAPVASPTPIPFPTSVRIGPTGTNALWALVAETHLFRSLDRGDTWAERPLPVRPLVSPEITFIDDHEGWLDLIGPAGTQCTFQGVLLFHTVDAGATWEQIMPSGLDPQCKGGLTFVDQARGYVSGHDPNHAPAIYRTDDGGRSWLASRPLPDPPGFTTRGAGVTLGVGAVRDFGPTLLVEAFGLIGELAHGYVFGSTDGGTSWRFVSEIPRDGAFSFVTASRWLQIALQDRSQETTDAGATWHSFASDYSQAAGVAPLVLFANAAVGYATVRGSTQRTLDGGAHWTAIGTLAR